MTQGLGQGQGLAQAQGIAQGPGLGQGQGLGSIVIAEGEVKYSPGVDGTSPGTILSHHMIAKKLDIT